MLPVGIGEVRMSVSTVVVAVNAQVLRRLGLGPAHSVARILGTGAPGCQLPPMLRIQVGPVRWELADAVAYSSMLSAWRIAADLLAVQDPEHSA
ncbi:hypothetical protein GCM10025792_10760 [Pseudonocardia tropica]|uniref:Uncharacterized protein n=1 Tax=Pseudonocardia alni subsp. carboxydivorans TaxID=415010 RepID=A0ABU9A972_PSEA5|nr:hypothetical protein [Pseudonocardia sediminis]